MPEALSFVTNASETPLRLVSMAPVAVGKSVDWIVPVTYALPAESTAMPKPKSAPAPPR